MKNILKNLIILEICFVLFISLGVISALGGSVAMVCGGDENIAVGCLDSEDLIHFGAEIPAERTGQAGGGVTEPLEEEPEEPKIYRCRVN